MNTLTLDSMVFDNFEMADMERLSNTNGGGAAEGMGATATALLCGAKCVEAIAVGTSLSTPIGWGVLAAASAGVAAYEFTH